MKCSWMLNVGLLSLLADVIVGNIDVCFADIPVCKPGQVSVYGVARHESTHVSCEVLSNPATDISFEWVFNTSTEKLDIQQSHFR